MPKIVLCSLSTSHFGMLNASGIEPGAPTLITMKEMQSGKMSPCNGALVIFHLKIKKMLKAVSYLIPGFIF